MTAFLNRRTSSTDPRSLGEVLPPRVPAAWPWLATKDSIAHLLQTSLDRHLVQLGHPLENPLDAFGDAPAQVHGLLRADLQAVEHVDQTTVTIKRVWLRGLLRVQHLVILHGDRLTRQGLRDGAWGAIEGDLDDIGNIICSEVVCSVP